MHKNTKIISVNVLKKMQRFYFAFVNPLVLQINPNKWFYTPEKSQKIEKWKVYYRLFERMKKATRLFNKT